MKKMMERIRGGVFWEKKNSKKGFTLVELIVVLVILAILMAIMIPALSGWIDKAKEKEVILKARNVEMAMQACLYEKYATNPNLFERLEEDEYQEIYGTKAETNFGLRDYLSDILAPEDLNALSDKDFVKFDKYAHIAEFYCIISGKRAWYSNYGNNASWSVTNVTP